MDKCKDCMCTQENFDELKQENLLLHKMLNEKEKENEKFKNDLYEHSNLIMCLQTHYEILKKRLETIANIDKESKYKQALEELEKENEELKNRLQTLDDETLTVEITVEEFETYKKLKQALEKIKDRIELYNDCYEGTPDECISDIKKYLL